MLASPLFTRRRRPRLFGFEPSGADPLQASILAKLASGGGEYWRLDEESGNRVGAIHGLEFTEFGGTIGSAAGKLGLAADLEASSSQYLRTPDSALLNSTARRSIAFWTRPESLATTVMMRKSSNTGANGFLMTCTAAGAVTFTIVGGNGSTSSGVLQVGVWTHYAVVFDGGGANNAERLRVFVNGAEVTPSYGGTVPATIPTNTAEYYLAYTSQFYDGLFDELLYLGETLSPAEIAWLYNDGAGRQLV